MSCSRSKKKWKAYAKLPYGKRRRGADQNMSEYWQQEKQGWNVLVWGSIHKHSDNRVKNAIKKPSRNAVF
jgi:hypothetical protein